MPLCLEASEHGLLCLGQHVIMQDWRQTGVVIKVGGVVWRLHRRPAATHIQLRTVDNQRLA